MPQKNPDVVSEMNIFLYNLMVFTFLQ